MTNEYESDFYRAEIIKENTKTIIRYYKRDNTAQLFAQDKKFHKGEEVCPTLKRAREKAIYYIGRK